MKNNIEDIKILEEFIDGLKQYNPKTGKDIKPTQFGEGQRYVYSNVYYAIDHILSDYKRVLKENEELKKSKITYEKVRDIQEKNKNIVDNNYIPKQKIKDKIEEINKMIAYEHNDAVIIQLGKQKRVLQKLLESEE